MTSGERTAAFIDAQIEQDIRQAIQDSRTPLLSLKNLAEIEALRKVLMLSHLIPQSAYSERGLDQSKIESHITEIFMRLESAFGGFSTFAED